MGPTLRQHFITHRLLGKLKADVYHHPQFDLPGRVKAPSVVTIHDLKYIEHPEFLDKRSRLKSIYIKKSLQRSLQASNQIIAVSQNTLNDLENRFDLDVEKATVIHHGSNPKPQLDPEQQMALLKFKMISFYLSGPGVPIKISKG